MKILLLVQAATVWAMVGLIWFVQVVHYPLFNNVGSEQFLHYEQLHQRLTTWVVAPLMLLELAIAIWLCIDRPAEIARWMIWTSAGLLAVIWLSTYLLQVPAHNALSIAFSGEQHSRLVNTNWLRTVAWSARGVLALLMISEATKASS